MRSTPAFLFIDVLLVQRFVFLLPLKYFLSVGLSSVKAIALRVPLAALTDEDTTDMR